MTLVFGGCGESEEEKQRSAATSAVTDLIEAMKSKDYKQACDKLTTDGQDVIRSAAEENASDPVGLVVCESETMPNFVPKLDLERAETDAKKVTDVDLAADGGKVATDAGDFGVEEVGGGFKVSDPSPLTGYVKDAAAGDLGVEAQCRERYAMGPNLQKCIDGEIPPPNGVPPVDPDVGEAP